MDLNRVTIIGVTTIFLFGLLYFAGIGLMASMPPSISSLQQDTYLIMPDAGHVTIDAFDGSQMRYPYFIGRNAIEVDLGRNGLLVLPIVEGNRLGEFHFTLQR